MQRLDSDKRNKMMLVGGILLLVYYSYTADTKPKADPALEAQCRTIVIERGNALASRIDQCREKAFAAAMTATSAQSAARQISSANQMETLSHTLSMAALGGGTILTILGALGVMGLLRRREER